MRWVLDIIAVLTAVGLIAAVIMSERARGHTEAQVQRAVSDLRRLELEIKYRSVTKNAPLNEFGWPITVDPAWFQRDLPHNTLVSAKRPWLEVAGEAEAKLLHPRVRVAVDESLAEFWYNPAEGVVRARVPVLLSDEEALALYNRINGTSLASLFDAERSDKASAAAPALIEEAMREQDGAMAAAQPTAPPVVAPDGGASSGEASGAAPETKRVEPAPALAAKPATSPVPAPVAVPPSVPGAPSPATSPR